MKKKPRRVKQLTLRDASQRKAFSSPLRMELLGLFTDGRVRSVAEMASVVGRPASAIHYHVRVLEKAGLLLRTGQRRDGRRPEALYIAAAEVFRLEEPRTGSGDAALKTMAAAFRMAERDMKAALSDPATRSTGPQRNAYGVRLHCRLARAELAELNTHLQAIEKLLSRSRAVENPTPDDRFVSLTVALMPLPNREISS